MATATNSSKKQRESYTLESKLKILDEVDKKRKKADICSQFSACRSLPYAGPKRKRARSAQYGNVDEVHGWMMCTCLHIKQHQFGMTLVIKNFFYKEQILLDLRVRCIRSRLYLITSCSSCAKLF